jgi:hypothetical protein
MTTYEFTTVTHYIFDAESDEEAINFAENNESLNSCVDHEEYLMLSTIYDDPNKIVKDYR